MYNSLWQFNRTNTTNRIWFGLYFYSMLQLAQCASALWLVQPDHFGFNAETAATNPFQQLPQDSNQKPVPEEFREAVQRITNAGISCTVLPDDPNLKLPDAIFPNNWMSSHQEGILIVYPMMAPIRRAEKRPQLIELISSQFNINQLIDLSYFEERQQFLEGTGSVVFDHINRLAYAALSPRTHPLVLDTVCQFIGYEPVTFNTSLPDGSAVYHTNIVMQIGPDFAILCDSLISDKQQRLNIKHRLENTGHEVITISYPQFLAFAGNMLCVENQKGIRYLIGSERAFASLDAQQIIQLQQKAELLPIPIHHIEQTGGGGIRCMLAENFLPRLNQ